MNFWTRRKFFLTAVGSGIATGARRLLGAESAPPNGKGAGEQKLGAPEARVAKGTRPLIISSSNGVRALDAGMAILKKGGDTLDAVLATVNIVEDDPEDDSVGYGGLPNEDGVVELDASVMHGPTRRAGSVASLRHIKNPSLVARKIMERTDHVMLAGEGALRFAEAHGFQRMNLLTERSRIKWLAWRTATLANWSPGIMSPEWKEKVADLLPKNLSEEEKVAWLDDMHEAVTNPPTGTINCLAVNEKGDISGTTTTSGLAWKIAGRVGDSPIIGAGLYVDNEVGAAGSTGRGEENIRVSGAHTIVELMRRGMSPTEACRGAVERIVRNYNGDKARLRKFYVHFYALNKDGVHGGATVWSKSISGRTYAYAVHDGTQARLVELPGLLEGVGE